MKQIIILIAIICVLPACRRKQVEPSINPNHISILIDSTDTLAIYPNCLFLTSLFEAMGTKDSGCVVRIRPITDKKLNPIETLPLLSEEESEGMNTEDYVFFRRDELAKFRDSLCSIVQPKSMQSDEVFKEKRNSECYNALSDELRYLSIRNKGNKLLLAYTNLFENSTTISCYSSYTMSKFKDEPKQMTQFIDSVYEFPKRLDGIKIVFIYLPTNKEDEDRFLAIYRVIQKLLSSKGAYVSLQATNQFLGYE